MAFLVVRGPVLAALRQYGRSHRNRWVAEHAAEKFRYCSDFGHDRHHRVWWNLEEAWAGFWCPRVLGFSYVFQYRGGATGRDPKQQPDLRRRPGLNSPAQDCRGALSRRG